jgi:hypothetical protein
LDQEAGRDIFPLGDVLKFNYRAPIVVLGKAHRGPAGIFKFLGNPH